VRPAFFFFNIYLWLVAEILYFEYPGRNCTLTTEPEVGMQAQNPNPSLSLGVRIFFGAVALVLMVGVALFFAPELVARRWPWPLTPFNTRFLGAFYSAELITVVVMLAVNRLAPGRLMFWMALVFTLIVSIVSLLYFGQFNPQRRITWTWFILYIGSALISALFLWWYRHRPLPGSAVPPSGLRRLYLQVEGALLGGYGLGLLLAPALFSAFWPWKIDDFHGQLYSAIFLTGAVAMFILSRAVTPVELLTMGLTQITLGLFAVTGTVIVDASVHKIVWSLSGTWVWLGMFALLFITGLGKLWWFLESRRQANLNSSVSPYIG
jgi:hypothetical protein